MIQIWDFCKKKKKKKLSHDNGSSYFPSNIPQTKFKRLKETQKKGHVTNDFDKIQNWVTD